MTTQASIRFEKMAMWILSKKVTRIMLGKIFQRSYML